LSNRKLFTLREICQATQGVQIAKNFQSKIQKKGFKRYFYISDFKHDKNIKYVEDIYPKKKFTSEDLIVSNTGSHGLVFTGKEGILSNNLFKVSFDNKIINKFFLLYFLESSLFKDFQSKRVRGTANPHMGHENFLNTPISLPQLSEQERIVAKLDSVFAEINKEINLTIQKTEDISHLLNSLIKNIFFLKNQKKLPLKDVANIINGYAFKSQDFCNDNTGIKSIKITNVGLNKFEENNKDYLPKEFDEKYSMFKAENDDLVFALTRSIIKGGLKLAKVPKSYHGALLNQRVALIKAKKNKVLLDYLYFYLHSDIVKKYVINNVNTLMQPNLSINDLKLLPVPLESLEKQKLIIEKLNTIDILLSKNKENLIKKNINLLQLKSSIIKTYLTAKTA